MHLGITIEVDKLVVCYRSVIVEFTDGRPTHSRSTIYRLKVDRYTSALCSGIVVNVGRVRVALMSSFKQERHESKSILSLGERGSRVSIRISYSAQLIHP